VPSRRFGLSLGVDLVPHKTCSLNCIFCEVGPTTCLTIARKNYVPIAEVERELKEWQANGGVADFVTVTGSGEPTLHTGFGKILGFINRKMKLKSVLLTNSTLMYLAEVRSSAARADIVKATFSAWDENSFRALMRPHPDLRFASLVEGLRELRAEHDGQIWLEVFIVPGFNSELPQIKSIANLAKTIHADRIQLNTAVRPTAEDNVKPVEESFLRQISILFEPKAEVIAKYSSNISAQKADEGKIQAMLMRRPCTAEDVSAAFSLDIDETKKILQKMVDKKMIRLEKRRDEEYFVGMVENS